MTQLYCQSCGLAMAKDPEGGGTNADGSLSPDYCSQCYQLGSFTEPWLSLEQATARAKGRIMQKKVPGFLAGMFIPDLSKFKRWAANYSGHIYGGSA